MIRSDSIDNESSEEGSVGTKGFTASVMNNLIFLNNIVCYFLCNSYIVHNWFCGDKVSFYVYSSFHFCTLSFCKYFHVHTLYIVLTQMWNCKWKNDKIKCHVFYP